jgi:hypothetical protein
VNGTSIVARVTAKPTPSISGSVQFQNPTAKPKGGLRVVLISESTSLSQYAMVQPDGSFSFSEVPPLKCRVLLGGPNGYLGSEIQVSGAAYQGGVLDILEGAEINLRIVANHETGRLHGTVMAGERDRPVPGALMVITPADDVTNWPATIGYQTESDGSYDMPHLPAKEYFLFAVDDPSFEYANPDAVRPYLERARRVRITPGGDHLEQVTLLAPFPR